ncbi:MAG TPA: cytochrome C oxidase subunit IV family protein [Myxococcaceae bacterium]|nr:cytochrome C oxidase subunit IV family protein [Myxococcaceae bacterium]
MTSTTQPADAPQAKHELGPGRLILNWFALCILTATTFGVSQIPMSVNYHLAAALCISVIKVTLVVLFFMHLWHGEGVDRIVFLTSFLFVLVLLFFVMADVGTRFTLSNSRIPPMPRIDQTMLPTAMPPGMSDVPRGSSEGPGPSSGRTGEQ